MTPQAERIALWVGGVKGWLAAARRKFYPWRRLVTENLPIQCVSPLDITNDAIDYANSLLGVLESRTDYELQVYAEALYTQVIRLADIGRGVQYCDGADCCWGP